MPDPEIVFHRFFTTLYPSDRELYKGKVDVGPRPDGLVHDGLVPGSLLPLEVLSDLQTLWNDALNRPQQNDGPFHFDYVESERPNALAFGCEGYLFIGITIPLLNRLWEVSGRLSASDAVANLVRTGMTSDQRAAFQVALFRIQLASTVCHEYTHHRHGHVAERGFAQVFFDEIRVTDTPGSLEEQTREIDADGNAAFLVLNNLLSDSERLHVVDWLGASQEPREVQDHMLFDCYVVAMGAAMFVRAPQALNERTIYLYTHPPQAARMNFLMQQAVRWCRQSYPELERWMTRDRFAELMHAVDGAIGGLHGGLDWSAQYAFLESDPGREYIARITDSVNAHVAAIAGRGGA